jgi:threonine/homoserine/homoserine lactone efflux protein
MTWAQLLSFVVAAEIILIIPGPSVLFTISRGVTYGRRAAVANVTGNASGALLQAILVSLGLGAIVATSAAVFTTLKLIGAFYLVYLGVRAIRDRRSLREAFELGDTIPVRSTRQLVRDGFIVGATNPKAALFYVAIVPQFVDAHAAHPALNVFLLSVLFAAMSFVSDCAYALLAGSIRNWIARRPQRLESVGGVGGLVMIGLGVRLAFTGRTD